MAHDLTHELDLLHGATNRLVRTVDDFHGADWGRPTDLPGWTRASVVAHLALNAEGLTGALSGIVEAEPRSMYASDEARDDDIAALSAAGTDVLRGRLMAGTTAFIDAVRAMPGNDWGVAIERTPGGRTFLAASVVGMRLREVEIHHADLDAGYTRRDWPGDFCAVLLDAMAKREWTESFQASPADRDGTWSFGGDDGPIVTGTAADLGWWLTGRGDGEGLASTRGALPKVGAW